LATTWLSTGVRRSFLQSDAQLRRWHCCGDGTAAAMALLPWKAGMPETLLAGQDNARKWFGREVW